jgi:photosystem II stability/assembly factor-like uncharacterized protein
MRACLRFLTGTSIIIATMGVASFVATASLTSQGAPVCHVAEVFYFGQNLVLVCTPEGLFKATDEGWRLIFAPSGWSEVKVTLGGTIYLYDDSKTLEIRRSVDGGETWTLMGKTPLIPDTEQYGHIFPSPASDIVFLGVGDAPFIPDVQGVYKSTDGGATWRRVLEGGNGNWVSFSLDFAQDGIAFAALSEYHTSLGIWKTEDWGETWFPVNDGLYVGTSFYGHGWVVVSPQFPQDQTAFTSDWTGLYKTTNGGESWFVLEEWASPSLMVFSPDYIHDQILLRIDPAGLGLSQDGGQTWRVIHD